MKSFFRTFIASFLGVFTAVFFMFIGFIMFIVFVGKVTTSAVSVPKGETVQKEGVIHLKLSHVVENLQRDPFKVFFSSSMGQKSQVLELSQLLEILNYAAQDKSIKGVLVDLSQGRFNWVIANEIRQGLQKIKGKPVVVFATNMTEKKLFVASAASRVYMMPEGSVEWNGFSSSSPYLKKTLEKFKVSASVIRAGKFKSAAEMFIADKMSPENRQQMAELLGHLWSYVRIQVAQGRKIKVQSLNAMADNMSVIHAKEALRYRLVDGLLYRDQLEKLKIDKVDFSKKASLQHLFEEKGGFEDLRKQDQGDYVAVIYATGNIVDGYARDGNQISSEFFIEMVNQVRKDKNAKALVVRVDSPGGSALASEEMHRALQVLKDKSKGFPIVASFGGAAASGGYYISAGADQIFADPMTVTGSIGVFALLFNGSQFFTEDLKVNFQEVGTNKNSGFANGTKPLSLFEERVLQKSVNRVYNRFLTVVAQGRNKTWKQVDTIAQGRVWSGLKAKSIGLVDQLGGLAQAIDYAAKKAQLKKGGYHTRVVNDGLSRWRKFAITFGRRLQNLWQFKGVHPNLVDFLKLFSKEGSTVYALDPRVPYVF